MSFLPLLMAAAVSCTKSGGTASTEESLELAPSDISAACTLNAKVVEVTANCPWTVHKPDDANWITLDKSSGSGNGSISMKILKNDYRSSRKAVLTVSTPGGIIAEISVTQEGNKDSTLDDTRLKLRIGSFNCRISTMDYNDANNNWTNRKARLINSVKSNAFDIFGVQECDYQLQNTLKSELSSEYECRFFSPYSASGNGDKAQGIIYRKNDFIISDWYFFWPSDNIDKMSVNDIGTSNYNRGGCCVVFTHKETGIKLFMMNTHGFLDKSCGGKWASVYAEVEKKRNPEAYPSFFVGDMNATEGDPASAAFRKHWTDSYKTASKREGPEGTFNSFNISVNLDNQPRIDFVYYRGQVEVQRYVCDDSKFGGYYPSDHCPVYTEFVLSKHIEQ